MTAQITPTVAYTWQKPDGSWRVVVKDCPMCGRTHYHASETPPQEGWGWIADCLDWHLPFSKACKPERDWRSYRGVRCHKRHGDAFYEVVAYTVLDGPPEWYRRGRR